MDRFLMIRKSEEVPAHPLNGRLIGRLFGRRSNRKSLAFLYYRRKSVKAIKLIMTL